MAMRVDIALNMDDGTLSVETVKHNKLETIAECGTMSEAVRVAKDYMETHGVERGDYILPYNGGIIRWTGASWATVKK